MPIGLDSVGVGPASKSFEDRFTIPILFKLDTVYLIFRRADFSFELCGLVEGWSSHGGSTFAFGLAGTGGGGGLVSPVSFSVVVGCVGVGITMAEVEAAGVSACMVVVYGRARWVG